jgi:anion-transporting  ArsA/GET3 family ATPase
VVQHNLSVLELRTDESFQEYLQIYFKVPRLARLTPLARVFDFIATGVPGPRDMLVVGKIAYEERRKESSTTPVWDLILVDCAAGGRVESHLAAAKAMLTLVKGGVIRAQVEWIDQLIRDSRRTTVVLCALPEEMPVTEAIELNERLRHSSGVAVDVCILNRATIEPITAAHRRLVTALTDSGHVEAVTERLGGSPAMLEAGIDLEARLYDTSSRYARLLRSRLPMPVVALPAIVERPGLTTTRAVSEALGSRLA